MKLFALKIITSRYENYSTQHIINIFLNNKNTYDLDLDLDLAAYYSPASWVFDPSCRGVVFDNIESLNDFIDNYYGISGVILFEYRLTKPEFCDIFFGKSKIKPYSKKYLIIENGVISDIATDKLNKLKTFQ